ncbi:MAG: exonuclease subunit SbcD [Myxococcota bacterium]|nr:exonuclease subunit SbcD [Myxococcota bacterium]
MSLRVIHTGDLHIGQKLKKNSRHEEHSLLLSWLPSVIDAEKAQVLLIAGDVFDCSTPAPKSQHLFNRFLASLESIPSLLSVIITAGNHDSAQRLEAMKPVLARIGIHIVGAHENRSAKWDDWLIPIRDHNQDVRAVVAAVPFVHEFRLGLKKGVGNKEQYSDRIKASFSSLYTHFARRAAEQYPEAPLIGMGHLTAISEEELVGPAPQNVHMALEKGMDGRIFDPRYCYVALGHIHKNYRIRGDANAYYCGSPLPCSIDEAEDRTRRGVWCLDVSDVHTRPTPRLIKAPIFRHLLRLRGSVEEVQAALLEHTWEDAQEPSFIWIKAETNVPRYDLYDVFGATLRAMDAEKRQYIVSVDNVIPELIGKKEAIPVDIRTTPAEVFALLLKEKGLDPKQPNLQNLFAYVLSQLGEHGATPHPSSNALAAGAAEKREETPKTFRVSEQASDTLVLSTESDAQNRGIHEIS